jgi:hypothetical protein
MSREMIMKGTISCDVMPYSLLEAYQYSGGVHFLHLQG